MFANVFVYGQCAIELHFELKRILTRHINYILCCKSVKIMLLPLKEITMTFDEFLNENGMWNAWVDFVEERGYTVDEFNMRE